MSNLDKDKVETWLNQQFDLGNFVSADEVGVTIDEDHTMNHPTQRIVIFDTGWSSTGHYSYQDRNYSPDIGEIIVVDCGSVYAFIEIPDLDELYEVLSADEQGYCTIQEFLDRRQWELFSWVRIEELNSRLISEIHTAGLKFKCVDVMASVHFDDGSSINDTVIGLSIEQA